jgi:large subunit ribosomal protein L6
MSKIGKLPINIPAGVTVKKGTGNLVEIGGPKGHLSFLLHEKAQVEITGEEILVKVADESFGNIHGVTRAILNNMVKGVTEGWMKTIELSGTGYKASTNESGLQLALGFSHPVIIKAPAGIDFEVKENKITVRGADKEMVGEIAARIRGFRPADPYKAKGFKYEGEIIRRKVGKAAKAAT